MNTKSSSSSILNSFIHLLLMFFIFIIPPYLAILPEAILAQHINYNSTLISLTVRGNTKLKQTAMLSL